MNATHRIQLYWGDKVNGWRIWGLRFGRNRYLTVAFSINSWETDV